MGGGKSKEVIQKSVEKTTQVFSKLPTEKSSAFLAGINIIMT